MDRRPLASRGTKWAHDAAKFLSKKNISPNDISMLSVVFSLFAAFFYIKATSNGPFLVAAAICIQLRLLCNLLDGMVAIEFNKKSIYGNLFNDIPDRFADAFIIIGAGIYSFYGEKSYGSALNLALVNAILAVLTAYIRVLGASLGTPMFFSGIMAKPQRMALLTASSILALFLGNIPVIFIALAIMVIGQCLTIVTRIRLICVSLKNKEQ